MNPANRASAGRMKGPQSAEFSEKFPFPFARFPFHKPQNHTRSRELCRNRLEAENPERPFDHGEYREIRILNSLLVIHAHILVGHE